MSIRALYEPRDNAMRIAVFSSWGPGNFSAAMSAAADSCAAMKVVLLVSDRLGTPSAELARGCGVSVIERDFADRLRKVGSSERGEASDRMHDEVLEAVQLFEHEHGMIDLAVLAYRRVIRGALFAHFCDRMINQHPADLTVLNDDGARRYIGISGLARSISDGVGATRTSTILVTEGVDEGEILGQGPWVPVDRSEGRADVDAHELLQKQRSDWPILTMLLQLICRGRLAVDDGYISAGHRNVYLDGRALPCGGVQM